MQRDMKVGMALGVALVGIVGALFFRRVPENREPLPPPLVDSAELDKQIAEKPRGPYIQGLDEFPDPPAAPKNSASAAAAAAPAAKAEAFQPPAFLTKQDESEHRTFLAGKPAPAPDPIAPHVQESPAGREVASHSSLAPAESPAHNRDWEPVPAGVAPSGPPRGRANRPAGAATRTHVIQSGDTLSNLASRYLGNKARFREIYDANRRVLPSPDNLPEGVTIVIPETARPHVAAPSAENAGGGAAELTDRRTPARRTSIDEAASGVAGDRVPGQLRFAPVRRSPLSAGRTSGAARSSSTGTPAKDAAVKPRIELDDTDPFADQ